MAKKSLMKQNEAWISKLLMLAFLIILFGLIIPTIGTTATSPAAWVSVVDFFTSIRTHLATYWMFYTLGGAILFAYLRNTKK